MEGTSNDDKYSKRRKEKNGICPICNRYNTWISWCQSCDPQLLTQGWTSGNETIDKLIKSTQLKATTYNDTSYLQWVPYDDLKDIEKIDKGGFATIYKATWKNGEKYIDPRTNERSIRDRVVVLKKLQNSKNISDDFLNEFKNHVDFHIQFNIIKIYGLTKDPKTGEYIFVMKYIKGGSLRNYLAQEFGNLKWKDKISMLVKIIEGLEQIHDKKIVHRDLHSGNILKDSYGTYISDLGLSIPTSKSSKSDNSIGVIPYMAPEVFCGKKPYTMASDIYSFGVLMSVISTGKEPFGDVAHDEHLVMKICEGKRPAFSINTPKDYIKLAYQCMDANPDKRPIARDIYNTINLWKNSFNNDTNSLKRYYKYSQEEIDGLKSIRQEFEKMDKIQFDASAIMTRGFHPNAIYTSRILNFDYLPEPVNSSKVTIINNTGDSRQIDCVISDFD